MFEQISMTDEKVESLLEEIGKRRPTANTYATKKAVTNLRNHVNEVETPDGFGILNSSLHRVRRGSRLILHDAALTYPPFHLYWWKVTPDDVSVERTIHRHAVELEGGQCDSTVTFLFTKCGEYRWEIVPLRDDDDNDDDNDERAKVVMVNVFADEALRREHAQALTNWQIALAPLQLPICKQRRKLLQ
jgi:hypothetical protein